MTEEQKAENLELSSEAPKKQPGSDTAKAEKKVVKPRGRKKAAVREVPQGRAYIRASYNNTLVTLTDNNGNTLAWSSAGAMGFRGPKKSTPYAASVIVKNVVEKAAPYKLRDVAVYLRGIGSGRDSAVRALSANGLNVLSIKDVTPIPHNGVRPPKARRV